MLVDVLKRNLALVIVGEKPGEISLRLSCYYANLRNHFWRILYETGLTLKQLKPCEYLLLPKYGIGLTDMIKEDNRDCMIESDAQQLYEKIRTYKPRIVAFNGKKPGRFFLRAIFGYRVRNYGLQKQVIIGDTQIFILPSTSPRNRYWGQNKRYWYELARHVNRIR